MNSISLFLLLLTKIYQRQERFMKHINCQVGKK